MAFGLTYASAFAILLIPLFTLPPASARRGKPASGRQGLAIAIISCYSVFFFIVLAGFLNSQGTPVWHKPHPATLLSLSYRFLNSAGM